MKLELNNDELENIKYCVSQVLCELEKNQFSSSFQFELEELNYKLYDILKSCTHFNE